MIMNDAGSGLISHHNVDASNPTALYTWTQGYHCTEAHRGPQTKTKPRHRVRCAPGPVDLATVERARPCAIAILLSCWLDSRGASTGMSVQSHEAVEQV
jgi:hypothetical protein